MFVRVMKLLAGDLGDLSSGGLVLDSLSAGKQCGGVVSGEGEVSRQLEATAHVAGWLLAVSVTAKASSIFEFGLPGWA